MKYRAGIFDLDGTLLDTLEDLADSMNEALATLGFPIHDMDRYRFFVGEGIQLLVARTIPEDRRDDATVELATKLYREAYGRNWHRKSRPYDGIMEMIAELQAASVPMAVLSNKPDHFTQLCMKHFFPAGTFQIILGQRETVARKPDPAAAYEIAFSMEIPPGKFAFIGDTETDIKTGLAAGMASLGVAWGFRPVEELVQSGATAIVRHPSEILPFFV